MGGRELTDRIAKSQMLPECSGVAYRLLADCFNGEHPLATAIQSATRGTFESVCRVAREVASFTLEATLPLWLPNGRLCPLNRFTDLPRDAGFY
ncbi:hypothetical protein [Rhodopirellula sp. P2]|uniref:hypothetical protein n=1 Tax=Rhodopirellula sp. P2 TaxID=2127060 RepID=UPI002367B255|nr:hypothetical protein [Rhodopirellula sp. P2]WDQ15487.1 hypothetical protein PSR62_17800 [Rhodopirellula sp. P2]